MTAVSVYKNGILLGTATATNGSATLASYSGSTVHKGRNVQITATDGTDARRTIGDRVATDNGTSLVMNHAFSLA